METQPKQNPKEKTGILLPIREAYEWKLRLLYAESQRLCQLACFQFVKRMNGNFKSVDIGVQPGKSCFQFVKRMNGNLETSVINRQGMVYILLPIREAYEWKPLNLLEIKPLEACFQFVKRMNGNREACPLMLLQRLKRLASNS